MSGGPTPIGPPLSNPVASINVSLKSSTTAASFDLCRTNPSSFLFQ